MTPNLLDELEERLGELKSTLAVMAKYAPAPGVLCAPTMEMGLGWKVRALLPKIEAAHATLADMAKRLEAAERDAAVIKLEAEKEFLRDWLQFIDAPNPVCCGNPTVGAEYGGMQEMVCCGSPAAEYIDLSELVTAMKGRLATIDATQEGEG